MKVKSLEALVDKLDADLAWRRAELSAFQRATVDTKGAGKTALLRSSVALLYAHWEGFVKEAVYLYLCFLAGRKLSTQQLRPEIVGLVVRSKLTAAVEAKSSAVHTEVVRSLRETSSQRAAIPTSKDAVRTESNLSYKVLSSIVGSIGLSIDPFEKHQDLIDTELVATRNRIVHGEHQTIAQTEWNELYGTVLDLMGQMKDQIQNAAVEQSYLAV